MAFDVLTAQNAAKSRSEKEKGGTLNAKWEEIRTSSLEDRSRMAGCRSETSSPPNFVSLEMFQSPRLLAQLQEFERTFLSNLNIVSACFMSTHLLVIPQLDAALLKTHFWSLQTRGQSTANTKRNLCRGGLRQTTNGSASNAEARMPRERIGAVICPVRHK